MNSACSCMVLSLISSMARTMTFLYFTWNSKYFHRPDCEKQAIVSLGNQNLSGISIVCWFTQSVSFKFSIEESQPFSTSSCRFPLQTTQSSVDGRVSSLRTKRTKAETASDIEFLIYDQSVCKLPVHMLLQREEYLHDSNDFPKGEICFSTQQNYMHTDLITNQLGMKTKEQNSSQHVKVNKF